MNVVWAEGDPLLHRAGTEITLPAGANNVLACAAEPRVLVLYGDSIPTLRLAAYDSDGVLALDLPPPPHRHFYYLSHHVDHEHAVVCVSTKHGLDWFFAVDADSRTLQSLNRAYKPAA